MERLICRSCGKTLPSNTHRNRRYCDNSICYNTSARKRGHERYAKDKAILLPFKQSERALMIAFEKFGNKPIEVDFVNKLGINWTFYQNKKEIQGNEAKVIGSYAYVIYTDNTMRIWKIY